MYNMVSKLFKKKSKLNVYEETEGTQEQSKQLVGGNPEDTSKQSKIEKRLEKQFIRLTNNLKSPTKTRGLYHVLGF